MLKKIGVVLHKKTNKTALVQIKYQAFHPKYRINFNKKKNYLINDNKNLCQAGMIVIIKQDIRISLKKSWILYRIIK